jgi:hypothetical protein
MRLQSGPVLLLVIVRGGYCAAAATGFRCKKWEVAEEVER